MGETMHALVALGANLPLEGDAPAATLGRAVKALAEEGLSVLAVSRFYATPCFPAGAGPDYVNAAVKLEIAAHIDAASTMAILHRIEATFGRSREKRWGMRTLDLDLLAIADSVLPDAETQDRWRNLPPEDQRRVVPDQLILPHPRLQDRAFVLVPLADVAPDWRHPRDGRTVAEMLADLPEADRAEVRPL
ncbi:MAG: 2-amino-4-hydroxy-6-hydroxymethyldihydropteridine diphosphokinase [Tabrizicola sp.]